MHTLTISQLGRRVGLSPKTIRFYEEIGLLAEPKRAQNGYRLYTIEVIKELSLIKSARAIGLPIAEIKKLLNGCIDQNCEHTKDYIESEISKYLTTLAQKIRQLEALKNKLETFKDVLIIDNSVCIDNRFCCNILQQLLDHERR